MRLIVTGTGRCGTGFASQVLAGLGWRSGHESVFCLETTRESIPDRVINDLYDADASWLVAPFLDHPALAAVKVIHQVRHPVSVMNSFLQRNFYTAQPQGRWAAFVRRYCPAVFSVADDRERAMIHYVLWNEMIEKIRPTAIRHRVEDGSEVFLAAAGIQCPPGTDLFDNYRFNSGGTRLHLTVGDYPDGIWKQRLAAYADRLGYDLCG